MFIMIISTTLQNLSTEDVQHLNKAELKAFKALDKMGIPVRVWWQNNPLMEDYRGLFSIDTEEEGAELDLDYYESYGGSERLNEVLNKAGLYFEWDNSAWASIWRQ